jgi:hypothetical protein
MDNQGTPDMVKRQRNLLGLQNQMLVTMSETPNPKHAKALAKMAVKINKMMVDEMRFVRVVSGTPRTAPEPVPSEDESESASEQEEAVAPSPNLSTEDKSCGRSIFSDAERKRMHEIFNQDPYPKRDVLAALVDEFDGSKKYDQIYSYMASLRYKSGASKTARARDSTNKRKRKR